MNPVQDKIAETIAEKFSVPKETIVPASTLVSLELDSLAVLELFDTLQDEFAVAIDETEVSEDITVGGLATYVSDKCAGAADTSGTEGS